MQKTRAQTCVGVYSQSRLGLWFSIARLRACRLPEGQDAIAFYAAIAALRLLLSSNRTGSCADSRACRLPEGQDAIAFYAATAFLQYVVAVWSHFQFTERMLQLLFFPEHAKPLMGITCFVHRVFISP